MLCYLILPTYLPTYAYKVRYLHIRLPSLLIPYLTELITGLI